jgi:hypothetical protein
MENEFVSYEIALALKELGFDEPCLAQYKKYDAGETTLDIGFSKNEIISKFDNLILFCSAPLYQQSINFLYICSNKQIDIELKGSDTHEERIRKIEQGCKDLRNLQNNKS